MSSYVVERSVVVQSSVERLHRLISDLREWQAWSPWEDLDPGLHRDYSGPDRGVGARYAWSGNRRAGRGTMEVVGETPERIDVAVTFEKPFTSSSTSTFLLAPAGTGTDVTWRMTGEQTGIAALIGRFVPMDRLLGKDFEKGLTRLKAAAETP